MQSHLAYWHVKVFVLFRILDTQSTKLLFYYKIDFETKPLKYATVTSLFVYFYFLHFFVLFLYILFYYLIFRWRNNHKKHDQNWLPSKARKNPKFNDLFYFLFALFTVLKLQETAFVLLHFDSHSVCCCHDCDRRPGPHRRRCGISEEQADEWFVNMTVERRSINVGDVLL